MVKISNMKKFFRSPSYAGAPQMGAPTVPFVCYRPNLDAETDLYNIDGSPVNIIDNSSSHPVLQNVASQILQPVESTSFDYSGLPESDVLNSMPPRAMDTSEMALFANNNLKQLDKDYKDYFSNQNDG